MTVNHPPLTHDGFIQYLYLLRYFKHTLREIYPLYPHPPPLREKPPIAGTLDALAVACTLQAKQRTAVAIVQEPGRTLLYVSSTNSVTSRRLRSHLERLWKLLRDYRTSHLRVGTGSEDQQRELRKQIYAHLYRACYRPYSFTQEEQESFRMWADVMKSAEDVPSIGQLKYILSVLESQSTFDPDWNDERLYQFAVGHANVMRDLPKCPTWNWRRISAILLRARGNIPPDASEFSLKDYADKALWLNEHVKRLLSIAEPKTPFSRLGGFLNIPIHITTISSNPSLSRTVDVSIPTLLPLLNGELDPSATPFTEEQLRRRRDESFPSMSGVDDVNLSGHHPHPELTLLSHLHTFSINAYPYIGLSRPACYACYRLFDAYNAKINSRGDLPYNLNGPDPDLSLPWVLPLDLASDRSLVEVGADGSIRLRGAMWEQFARTMKQDVRDLWMRAVSFQRVSRKSAELLGRLNRISGSHGTSDDEDEAKEGIASIMRALRDERPPEVSCQASS